MKIGRVERIGNKQAKPQPPQKARFIEVYAAACRKVERSLDNEQNNHRIDRKRSVNGS